MNLLQTQGLMGRARDNEGSGWSRQLRDRFAAFIDTGHSLVGRAYSDAAEDWEALSEFAHKLAGTARAFGLGDLGELARAIEGEISSHSKLGDFSTLSRFDEMLADAAKLLQSKADD